jgi:Uma2 family endonuclease
MSIPESKKRYSYADYLQWPEGQRIELIDGIPYYMVPAPSKEHQDVLRYLFRYLDRYFEDKNCDVYIAPFDVRLFGEDQADDQVFHVLQPDLTIICDRDKLDERGCNGAPDVVIEILSPSSLKTDKIVKRSIYEKAHVHQYWIADPIHQLIEIYELGTDGLYGKPRYYTKDDRLTVSRFEGLQIDLSKVFTK